jgi:hypothetical protein
MVGTLDQGLAGLLLAAAAYCGLRQAPELRYISYLRQELAALTLVLLAVFGLAHHVLNDAKIVLELSLATVVVVGECRGCITET